MRRASVASEASHCPLFFLFMSKILLVFAAILCSGQSFQVSSPIRTNNKITMDSSSSTTALLVADYTSQAISLFNNMKTPATVLLGGLMPLALLSPIPIDKENDTKFQKALR